MHMHIFCTAFTKLADMVNDLFGRWRFSLLNLVVCLILVSYFNDVDGSFALLYSCS
jgi:hypothetical protein